MNISFEYHRGTEDNSWEKYDDVQRIEIESGELKIFCRDKNELYFNLNQCSNLQIDRDGQAVVESKETWRKARRRGHDLTEPEIVEFREVVPNFPLFMAQNIDAVRTGVFYTPVDYKEGYLDCERIENIGGVRLAWPKGDYVIRLGVTKEVSVIRKTDFEARYAIIEDEV